MGDGVRRDVFVSHEKGDGDVALELAGRLRAHGFSTWCYEEDSIAGSSYLVQIDRAIEAARAVIVVVSPRSLRSPHVRNEIVRAYECQKQFIPIRRDLDHEALLTAQDDEDDERRREWRMAFGASVSIPWDTRDPERVVSRIIDGLHRIGIAPGAEHRPYVPAAAMQLRGGVATQPMAASTPPPPLAPIVAQHAAQLANDLQLARRREGLQQFLRAPYTRVALAGVVGVLGVMFNVVNIFGMGEAQREYFYRISSLARVLDVTANALGLWLNVQIARTALRLTQDGWQHEAAMTRHLDRLLLVIGAWAAASLLFVATNLANYGTLRAQYTQAVIWAALLAGLQAGFVRYLFSLDDRRYPTTRATTD